MKEITIRHAREADLPALLELDRHIKKELLLQCIRLGQVLVLQREDAILGILRYSLFWQNIPFLDLLHLQPQIRGKGYGSAMMTFWEREMAELGYKHVLLSTQEDETAQFFYDKLGYRRAGAFLPPEQEANELMFTKAIP